MRDPYLSWYLRNVDPGPALEQLFGVDPAMDATAPPYVDASGAVVDPRVVEAQLRANTGGSSM